MSSPPRDWTRWPPTATGRYVSLRHCASRRACTIASAPRTTARKRGSLAPEHVIDQPARPARSPERAFQLDGVIHGVHPFQERDGLARVVLQVAVEHAVEHAGVRLAEMAKTQGELLLGLRQRNAFLEVEIEHAHQADPVGARLAMHEHRVLDAVE